MSKRKPPSPGAKMTGDPKEWLNYQDKFLGRKEPLLYPVTIEMVLDDNTNDMKFEMLRMRAPKVLEIFDSMLDNVPDRNKGFYKDIIEHYIGEFEATDKPPKADEAPLRPPSALDFDQVKRSVIYVIYLNNDNWSFSGHRQFNSPNDDPTDSKIRQIGTFSGNRGILLRRAAALPRKLKYDYYVTVHNDGGRATDIIIDPDDDPTSGSGGGNQTGN